MFSKHLNTILDPNEIISNVDLFPEPFRLKVSNTYIREIGEYNSIERGL